MALDLESKRLLSPPHRIPLLIVMYYSKPLEPTYRDVNHAPLTSSVVSPTAVAVDRLFTSSLGNSIKSAMFLVSSSAGELCHHFIPQIDNCISTLPYKYAEL